MISRVIAMRNPRCVFASFIAFLTCWLGYAMEETVTAEAQGWGTSREAAIQSACMEGVKKINGFLFATESVSQSSVSRSSKSSNGKNRQSATVNTDSSREMRERVKGAIRGYDVITLEQQGDGQWHAVLSVNVLKYKTPGIDPNTRRRIVVAPLGIREKGYRVGDQLVAASSTAGDLRDGLEKFLVQSRRFTVLGRQETEAVLKEKNLILRETASVDEYAKIGATLGTDYLLCGEIKELAVLVGTSPNLFTDQVSRRIQRARIAVTYTILVMPTSQIKWAGKAVIDFTAEQCRAFRGDAATAYNALLDGAAREICAQALGNIYPVRGMQVNGNGEIVLNQGGELHYEGELLDAFRLGDKIVDVYAKESLGRVETRIATIQIVRVDAKLSYARAIDGAVTPADIEAGIVCRPSRAMVLQRKGEDTDSIKPPTRNEGVRLPFD